MKVWIPWGLKGAFIALAIVLDRLGMLSQPLATMLITATGGASLAGIVATYVHMSASTASGSLKDALSLIKGAVASPAGALAAVTALEKALGDAKAAAATGGVVTPIGAAGKSPGAS